MKIRIVWIAAAALCILTVFSIIYAAVTVPSQTNNKTASSEVISTSTQSTKQVVSPVPTIQPTKKVVRVTPTSNPVCNEHATNTPCVQFATIQDAAVGESSVGAIVHTGTTDGVTWVRDDITNVAPSKYDMGQLNDIQFTCFNIQQAIWWGLKSTINNNGSQTFIKSPLSEVDITFIDNNKVIAGCNLTSKTEDKIDKAGMWDDGDFVGAWPLYDTAYLNP
jgi:hypothetical protein